ncbi:MAG: hypothetical protein V4507_09980 [Verrucomicrobiota bacterium]
MIYAPLASSQATPKAIHSSPHKTQSPKHKSDEKSAFDSQLKDALPDSEDSDKKEVKESKLSTETADTATSSDTTKGESKCDPLQTLFPAQMNIAVAETAKSDSSNKSAADGVIFPNTENKSDTPSSASVPLPESTPTSPTPSTSPTLSLISSSTMKGNSIEVRPSRTNSKQESSQSSTTITNTTLSFNEGTDDNITTSIDPSLESLMASIKDTPVAIDDKNPLNSLLPTPVSQDTLKNATSDAKPESLTLSSQHRLETVLDSVFEEKPLPTPRRIEVQLQTPQGSQITLYIARVNQELRAQFSANTNQAFTWLQNEIHQLRTLNSGESIRWLPAQMEATPLKTETAGKSSDEGFGKDKDRDSDSSVESLFDLFKPLKPSTRRLA